MSETSPTAAPTASRLVSLVRGFATGILGLAYAFIIWNATFYLIEMAQAGISGYGWTVLVMPVIVPMIVFTVALMLTRRRALGVFIVVMLAGLGLSAVFWVDTLSYALRNGASLLS
ncbi:hypothetical protein ACIPV2_04695 [Microbacterium sp. NPDC089987]|uniref:hypothetical protein n=1 Tax=Microbacterium sp. NPDC089987 TaxID=3364202 RepID=UPI00380AE2EA